MSELTAAAFGGASLRGPRPRAKGVVSWSRGTWVIVAVLVIAAAAAFVVVTRARPTFDAFGWLVWGRETLHWRLNTDGAPSWKPMTFLFTLPYALAGRVQLWLWVMTAVSAALAAPVFAGRIAYALTAPARSRRYAPAVAATIAAIGVLGINNYAHLLLIANSDPMIVTLCLAAIDSHLSRRPRLAFVLLVLVSLGRPEGWTFAGLYAVWAWRERPQMRRLVAAGAVLVPAAWFVIPAITSHSWFISGDLALDSANVIRGNKITGVIERFRGLYGVPMQLGAVLAVALAVIRRDRALLTLTAAAVLWVAIEIGLALHGWSAVPRYLIEPAAVIVVVVAAAVGRLIAEPPAGPEVLRFAGIAAAVVLAVALVPYARHNERITRAEVREQRQSARQLDRLRQVIAQLGGAATISACGQPVTALQFQSTLAWELGLNVGSVGYTPTISIHRGTPVVWFQPRGLGWRVRTANTPPAQAGRCDGVHADTARG